jgi:Fur family peroxide stress response transcriptional regulator
LNQKIDSLAKTLIKKNIKPSYQRIKILEYLIMKRNHPTVDRIFNDLVKEIPTLSKATVYNTLDLFKKENLARVVTIENNETRYDVEVISHGHFKCEICGNIYDFDVNIDNLPVDALENFKINEKNVYFKGICPKCLK